MLSLREWTGFSASGISSMPCVSIITPSVAAPRLYQAGEIDWFAETNKAIFGFSIG
jgi:hypothetical protein